ncbi:MBL fold metallo-hydrolase [Amycolatopsis thermophila]|uniref:Ribonuclease BN (tRNA processing enzyme) n=1 Tax=Amycolatopsis thermophila TaxID=206084 RepID=A0ABU0EQZ5_9PSEU|nr:MBL fold metallo-hydrolase [Amycolatopsis thermophila]MDQ0377421.1 ribonuclease BN (tRNA processing enzyme) [Amycolatopsis thermophila]
MSELTVLGSCGAWPEPGRACAGFLLSHEGFRLVLDLGYGTIGALLGRCPRGEVDAVIVTHRHPDHCVDVSALARVRHYEAPDRPKIPLHCEPGVLDVLRALEPRPDPTTVFEVRAPEPGRLGPFRLEPIALPHHVPVHGIRLEAPGLTLAYTGDCGPTRALRDLARDADLFIADATLQRQPPEGSERNVMTATEATTWAQAAGARRLLLTHIWPGSDRAVSAAQARAAFDGEVLVAEEGLVVAL